MLYIKISVDQCILIERQKLVSIDIF